MTRILGTFLILMGIHACMLPESEEPFHSSEATPVKVVASMSVGSISQAQTVESDTILPTDSIMLQGNFAPNRYIKTTGHWWTIDGEYITDEYYVRWGFPSSGKHEAVFWVKDQFGDLMSDTVFIWVNRPPILDSLASPGTQSWGIPASQKGLQFSWHATDDDPNSKLKHQFKLFRKSCANLVSDSLILDTVLSQPGFAYWKTLTPLCRYSWQVLVQDEYQVESQSHYTWVFYTKGDDSLGAISLTPSSPSILASLVRLGDTTIEKMGPANTALVFPNLPSGEYRIILKDTVHPGFENQILRITLSSGEYRDLGTLSLQDKSAPEITCLSCSQDSIANAADIRFTAIDSGCGLDKNSITVLLDGLPIVWSMSSDTIQVVQPKFPLIPRAHPLNINAMDKCGNLGVWTYYLQGDL